MNQRSSLRLREVRRLEAVDAHEVEAGAQPAESGLLERSSRGAPEQQRAELEVDQADLLVELARSVCSSVSPGSRPPPA